ncbi:MAG: Na/Pi cotransporter family protein [Gammaproteobacteria bacterium]|nr:Na/Pi cotransporter family protein [Gammaproteobacteria bacterium]
MTSNLDLWQLLGGVGLFLFAMSQIETALKALAGRAFRKMLHRYTDHPLQSAAAGTVSTAMLQSSSLVGLMVLAFVGAGIMSLENALGVIFGANLGTTFTGWIVTLFGFKLDLGLAALPLVGIGALVLVGTRGKLAEGGRFVAATGLLLMGLGFMKDSVAVIATQVDITALTDLALWQFLLFGVILTAIIQSSSATIMIALTALHAEVISLPAAAAVAIGADLGTTTTIIIGALPGPSAKKRVALAHVIFNLTNDTLAFLLLAPLLGLVAWLGIRDPMFSLVAFHSIFNLAGVILFLPLLHIFARFLNGRFQKESSRESQHLLEATPEIPDAAIPAIEKETGHLIARVINQNRRAFSPPLPTPPGASPVPFNGPMPAESQSFDDLYRSSKRLEGEIVAFAVRLQARPLEHKESARLNQLLSAVRFAVHSAKSLRDIRHNLMEFEDSPQAQLNAFLEHLRSVMTSFYAELYSVPYQGGTDTLFRDFAELLERVHAWHDQLHREIIHDISKDRVDEAEISSLLNVNRELLNSNISLIMAIKDYHLEAAQSEAFRQLPGAA